VGKTKGKKSLGRPGHRWEDNIKIGLQEVGLRAWIGSSGSVQRQVASACK
jgi:hypothetical protein